MIKLLVFDFDGTLADTKDFIFMLLENAFSSLNYKFSNFIKKELGNQPLQDLLDYLNIPREHARKIISSSNAEQVKEYNKVRMVRGVSSLRKIKIEKIILSNNTKEFVKKVLLSKKINFFKEIYGAEDFIIKSDKLKQIIREKKLSPREVIYIGDKSVDIDVAREAKCISVTIVHKASWSPRKEILEKKPDYVITSFLQLNSLIKKLNLH